MMGIDTSFSCDPPLGLFLVPLTEPFPGVDAAEDLRSRRVQPVSMSVGGRSPSVSSTVLCLLVSGALPLPSP